MRREKRRFDGVIFDYLLSSEAQKTPDDGGSNRLNRKSDLAPLALADTPELALVKLTPLPKIALQTRSPPARWHRHR